MLCECVQQGPTGKGCKNAEKMLSTSKQHAKHSLASQNTQHILDVMSPVVCDLFGYECDCSLFYCKSLKIKLQKVVRVVG